MSIAPAIRFKVDLRVLLFPMKRFDLLFCLTLSLSSAGVYAAWGDPEYEFDDNESQWQEIAPQLPPYPKMDDALPFQVRAATRNQFYIDAKSVSVGKDGVVHYTLIVKSASGAMNISYEGIRCQGRERKLYAFGQPDGSWRPNQSAKWLPIRPSDPNKQQQILYEDFFCPQFAIVDTAKEAVAALKRGKHPRAEQ